MNSAALHQCLRSYPGAALELSADGVVRASNGRLDALVDRELQGTSFDAVVDDSSLEKWRRILREAGGTSPPCTWELALVTPRTLEVRTFIAIWSREDSEPTLWLLEHSSDPKIELLYGELSELNRELVEAQRKLIVERGRLAQALEEARAAVQTRELVTAIVSHDLRSPLDAIVAAAGLLEMTVDDERVAMPADVIRRSAARMNRLIGDLLDVGSIGSGHFEVELETVSLADLLQETCGALAPDARSRDRELLCELPETLPPVRGDRDRLQQVLSNLVDNAIKFAPPESTVVVRARAGENEVIVSVDDEGPGIPESELPRIFDRFWRASRSRRGGTGLGLAISKGIVEAHGGRIWAQSVPGAGSTFFFALPAAEPDNP